MRSDPTPRWRASGLLRHEPVLPLVLSVRDIRVLFALTDKNYRQELPTRTTAAS
jgi:hypothetical protein